VTGEKNEIPEVDFFGVLIGLLVAIALLALFFWSISIFAKIFVKCCRKLSIKIRRKYPKLAKCLGLDRVREPRGNRGQVGFEGVGNAIMAED